MTGNGFVGINNNAPAYALDVTGSFRLTGSILGNALTGNSAGSSVAINAASAAAGTLAATAVTVSNSSGIVLTTSGNHGLSQFQAVVLSGTTAPGNTAFGTVYYVATTNFSATAISLSTTLANAIAGTIIAYSSTGTSVSVASTANTEIPGLTVVPAAAALGSGATAQVQQPSIVLGGAMALPTTATAGFPYIPTCAGTPTGTPESHGGSPIVFDTSGGILWVYAASAWRAPYTPTKAVAITWQ